MKKFIFTLGTTAILSAGFVGAASASTSGTYHVEKGDTLWKVAQKHSVSVDELKDANNLTSNIIYPNQELNVATIKEMTHKVQQGNTLWSISQQYGVTVDQIKEWNGLKSDLIYPGEQLKIQSPNGQAQQSSPSVAQAAPEAQQAQAPAEQTQEEQQQAQVEQTQEEQQQAQVEQAQKEQQQAQAEQAQKEQQQAQAEQAQKEQQPAESSQQASGKSMTVEATAYTANCAGCSGTTATGVDLKANPNQKVIAVDPSVIPLGSKVYVEGYGEAVAADTGGAIKGNRIDVFVPAEGDAQQFGRKSVKITVMN
ncbi:LysM peptidoglycan-binding domain-containing protein [Priestia megaterium]|uniref:Cell wall-binding protein yocH n=1 Tax=Priestia megaterium (strain ATCC 14581 / DSM 32 / CCUG 1817 / JCM 2506 / NBRC 15308 / NCIMB 9376 / NCTC 10342 / NRRL B-14308 / VKM B-512 / Ford 19) TaxID=1348623 RepID=A0A0B6AW34_PRIM2|nr:3D domain-containing protein [Priestia megaterium]AJI24089.1 cell wall-binding protein yocH [Priestia megaterium NBRC 15308 = ATCC 14581]KFN04844.1 cell wall-binding protein yocH [Priestia megaterium]KGJ80432.1 peptidoglycan-binding protein [Priestia megaterium NBRC 15308 = ATCC 14581]MDR4231650.1 LysM peptidoglycan-binding domain-containing protein [Priestia megaterium]MED3806461.1 LysM peptidoglycan-binding domain-containing protein [Priestia megaterium]